MQVIGTEAQQDSVLTQELTAELAAVSPQFEALQPLATPLVSSVQSSEAAPLTSQTAPFAAPQTEAGPTVQPLDALTGPTAGPSPVGETAVLSEPEPTAEAPAQFEPAVGCEPDISGAPYCVYTVEGGDTLSEIAADLGITNTAAFSGAELLALSNGLNDAENWLIVPGQELRVPVESGVIHTMRESDSISGLAEVYGVTTADLIAANGFADPNNVPIGAEIIVPSPTLWPWSGPVAAAGGPEEPTQEEEATEAAEAPVETPEGVPALAQSEEATPEAEETATDSAEPGETEESGQPGDSEPSASDATPSRSPTSRNANPSVAAVREQFAAGYIAGGGPERYLDHILSSVIACESGYNVRAYNPAGPFYGLMQFLPQTWANTGGGDWFDAWQQGHNTGVLLQSSHPDGQWPVCWGTG